MRMNQSGCVFTSSLDLGFTPVLPEKTRPRNQDVSTSPAARWCCFQMRFEVWTLDSGPGPGPLRTERVLSSRTAWPTHPGAAGLGSCFHICLVFPQKRILQG